MGEGAGTEEPGVVEQEFRKDEQWPESDVVEHFYGVEEDKFSAAGRAELPEIMGGGLGLPVDDGWDEPKNQRDSGQGGPKESEKTLFCGFAGDHVDDERRKDECGAFVAGHGGDGSEKVGPRRTSDNEIKACDRAEHERWLSDGFGYEPDQPGVYDGDEGECEGEGFGEDSLGEKEKDYGGERVEDGVYDAAG